jgi:hypothetical protein
MWFGELATDSDGHGLPDDRPAHSFAHRHQPSVAVIVVRTYGAPLLTAGAPGRGRQGDSGGQQLIFSDGARGAVVALTNQPEFPGRPLADFNAFSSGAGIR